jgi:hypothetical protein
MKMHFKHHLRLLRAAFVPLALAVIVGAGPAAPTTTLRREPPYWYMEKYPAWSTDPIWNDGKAEFSTYVGTTQRYGQARPTTARIILVKEDLVRATLVKSDAGPVPGKTIEALKQIFVADFPTGTYAYHQMASLFFDRASLELLKETMSHTESCGMTYVSIAPTGGRLMHEAHSYWDGEADRRVPIVWPAQARPHVFWDALPVWLRTIPRGDRDDGSIPVWLLPSQIAGRSPIASTRPVAATIRFAEAWPVVRVPYGDRTAYTYTVETASGTDTLWFSTLPPHVMLKLATADGRRLELKKTQRLDYWNHRAIGDEKLVD